MLRLQLTAAELDALSRQGFVTSELRGNSTVIHKLRFRLSGRQRVYYLGSDLEYVAEVRDFLLALQMRTRLARRLEARKKAVRQLLRGIKPRLTQHLAESGYRLHGRALRQRRPTDRSRSAGKTATDSCQSTFTTRL
jgi:hypothetical protein